MTVPAQPTAESNVTVPLLTVARFQEITGSTAEPTSEQLYTAQRAVESYLRRGLAKVERTERCRIYRDGMAYPRCTPLVSVSGGLMIDGPGVYGSSSLLGYDMLVDWPRDRRSVDITYIGGWDADELPQPIEDALARETLYRLAGMSSGVSTAGATSVSTGDVSITWSAPRAGSVVTPETVQAIHGYRWSEWVAL